MEKNTFLSPSYRVRVFVLAYRNEGVVNLFQVLVHFVYAVYGALLVRKGYGLCRRCERLAFAFYLRYRSVTVT